MQVLTFQIAQLDCALKLGSVQEVIPIASMTRVPGQPAILEGFLNLRGSLLPVLRMGALFGLGADPDAYSPVIVLETGGEPLGLLVDRVDDILTVEPAGMRRVDRSHTLNECVQAEFTVEGRTYALLDAVRVVLAEESRRITELKERLERRLTNIGVTRP